MTPGFDVTGVNDGLVQFLKKMNDRGGHAENIEDGVTILWPVVPKINTTVIHYAQINTITRISDRINQVQIFPAPIGCKEIDSNEFGNNLRDMLKRQKVDATNLNDKMDQNDKYLKKVLCDLKLKDVADFIKDYGEKRPTEISKDDTRLQRYISPLFQYAILLNHIEKNSGKYLILAGMDEETQWNTLIEEFKEMRTEGNKFKNSSLELLLIPRLDDGDGRLVNQTGKESRSLACFDKEELKKFILDNGGSFKWFEFMFSDSEAESYDNKLFDIIWERIMEIKGQ